MASIVIAEDDKDIADVLSAVLAGAGHAVQAVPDGPAALDMIVRVAPDLVILDHHMPGMSGIEVAYRLRSEKSTAAIPVIMLSAATPAAARGLCDITITKPVRAKHLLEAADELLAARAVDRVAPEITNQMTDVPRLLAVSGFLARPDFAAGLDAFAERLAELAGVPTAVITLILNDTVVVAGSYGLPTWVREAGGVLAEWSPDTIVVAEDVPVLIGDSRAGDEYADTPLFAVSGVRSYASVPLHSPEGHIIGTLCVMSETPGACTESTVQILHSQRISALDLLSPAGHASAAS
ncbi:response regulator [Actinoplanes awajinensis]|uniref:Chemotaxis protein n=1 Tax=Actinoplanes awajinensis subsp. mycoplanecinus TaxID=135947 RepID=A0A101JP66_9ACTN|nr:response regulator [Actinoplanes awajinensis]KUL30545.1 chemotaxis protein [Actinoplanes awajinensis subsp. mycoplanecinus]